MYPLQDVARAGGVWAALASAVGMESLLAPPKGSDLDTVDIFAGDIPLRIPVLHRRKARHKVLIESLSRYE